MKLRSTCSQELSVLVYNKYKVMSMGNKSQRTRRVGDIRQFDAVRQIIADREADHDHDMMVQVSQSVTNDIENSRDFQLFIRTRRHQNSGSISLWVPLSYKDIDIFRGARAGGRHG
jgi:hypothetical protein